MSNNDNDCNNQGEQYVFNYTEVDTIYNIKNNDKCSRKCDKKCHNSCDGPRCESNVTYIKIDKCYNNEIFKLSKHGELEIKLLNIYNITFSTYANVCPYSPQQHLPINVEYDKELKGLEISVTVTNNSFNIYGVIPAGAVFRLYTQCRLTKYFECAQIVGSIGHSNAIDTLEAAQLYTINRKIRYIPQISPFLSLVPTIAFPLPPPAPDSNYQLQEQYPYKGAIFPWEIAVIPWKIDQAIPLQPNYNPPPIIVNSNLPPNPLPPPVINGYDDNYEKFRSIGDTILFYIGLDGATIDKLDPRVSVFVTNFEDRGYSGEKDEPFWKRTNYKHKTYMAALSVDKLQFYQEKIQLFINTAFDDVTTYGLPLISSFQKNLILFFLRIHVGGQDFPDYVIRYFSEFVDFIGSNTISPDPNNPKFIKGNQQLLFGNMTAPCIFEYFRQKNIEVNANKDETTLMYWWAQAGLSSESLVTEVVHNIIAFSQFTNVIFSTVWVVLNPNNPLNPQLLPKYPNFFNKYKEACGGEQKLNVVRELFRILVPNSSSFSNVIPKIPDPNLNDIQSRHLHQSIMISNVPVPNPLPPPFDTLPVPGPTPQEIALQRRQAYQAYVYFTYNPNQYLGNSTLDNLDKYKVVDDFTKTLQTSTRDQETVVDITTRETEYIIPIFPKPTYTPFGLGYRRCPGEIMVYNVVEVMLEKFRQADFEIRPIDPNLPLVSIAPFKQVPDNIFVKRLI